MLFDQLMSKERAAEHYTRVTIRQLSSMSTFGVEERIQRETEFLQKFTFKSIFSKIQQGKIFEFRFSVQFFS